MCFPPLSWQTYDIDFQAPKFENGEKVADATITVKHNAVIIHDKVRLPKGTGAGGGRKEVPKVLSFFKVTVIQYFIEISGSFLVKSEHYLY